MADQVSGIAGGATGSGLGGLTGALQGGISNLLNSGQGLLDKWFPPEKREELSAKIAKFATERPKLAAFLLSQIALSGGPLALFVIMSLTVLVFALVAGLLVGVVGALLFTVFCVGVALIIILPLLFMTTFAACFIFLWGLGAYYIVKWFNKKPVPGVHEGGMDNMKKEAGVDGLVNGDLSSIGGPNTNGQPPKEKKEHSANGHAPHGEDKENQSPHPKSQTSAKRTQPASGKGTGADVGGVGDVKKKVGGVTSTVGS